MIAEAGPSANSYAAALFLWRAAGAFSILAPVQTLSSDRYRKSREHRYHVRRRALKKSRLVLLILAALCPFSGLFILAFGFWKSDLNQRSVVLLGAIFFGAGLAALALRWILGFFQEKHTHYHASDRMVASGKSGAVLVLVLILLGLVAALVAQVQFAARAALGRERVALQIGQLRQAAADAARGALQVLADDPDLRVDHLDEDWARPREVADPSGVATVVRITDENRFFDLNNLDDRSAANAPRRAEDMVMDLLTACGDFAPVDKTTALADWMDEDDAGLVETPYYLKQNPPAAAANRPLWCLREILAVKGWTRALFDRRDRERLDESFRANLLELVTVNPIKENRPTPLNVNTAPAAVLYGLFGPGREEAARLLLGARKLMPIRSVDFMPPGIDPELVRSVRPYLSVKSSLFRIEVRAYAEGRYADLRVLARRNDQGTVEVVQWVF
jgi:type II secretory pathway component PulK